MNKSVEAIGLTKYYNDFLAVDHVSFDVEKGEIFGFLGPNGAGKTTTIRMLTGMSIPSEGTARIMGFDIQKQSVEAKEQMGIVPDVSNVYNDLSAWDNLDFTGRLYDMPRESRKRRAKELLEMFGLYERRGEKVQGFSRGMKRRVCIAMALMNDASILFLDEPTSGLDVQSIIIIRELIHRLNDEGLTIFLTTHNIEEANQMCDRVAIINHGKIVAIDTPERLKRTVKSLQSVEVVFEASPQGALTDLEKLPKVNKVLKEGDKFRLFTDDPSSVYSSIWDYVQKNGLKLLTVNTLGPSLEEVFVKLTGITPSRIAEESNKVQGRGKKEGGRRGINGA
ncbi:MAG: ABC transporter ATP-binding protein [Candidatus Bathyarchaeia archaeon]